jgi:hypothetical protein
MKTHLAGKFVNRKMDNRTVWEYLWDNWAPWQKEFFKCMKPETREWPVQKEKK